eukprot:669005-Pyramimonas_sp.AAC.1
MCSTRGGSRTTIAVHLSWKDFGEWIQERTATGILHKSMKNQPLPAVELDIQGSAIYRPIDIMDEKVKKFKKLWAPRPISLTDTRDLFNRIRAVAVYAPLEPISEATIVRACKRMKPRTGMGVD